MAESLIQAELLAACSSLGYSDGVQYHKEAYCLETVKDLIRYLRRDDESHDIRRALGETKVVQTDLIPIVKFHHKDKELFDVTLRLLVNLTNPVLLLFKEELPEDKISRQRFLQMVNQQQAFKEAFADEQFWSIIVNYLGEILNKDWEDREEEERLILERILILIRNVLSVATSPDEEKRTDDDASIHDQVLWALHLARIEDLLLYISSSNNEQALCMHVIEIISLMLKEQDASQLANAGLQRSQSEKEKDEKELMEMRKREAMEKQQKIKKHYSARHSRFGGTYYVMNMKSISDRDIIAHKHISNIGSLNFDQSKRSKKIPKNRLPMKDVDITRRSTLAIRLLLQEFCIEFLNGAFNSLMYIVKDSLNRAKAQEHDETYYLWAIKFFLEFNRKHNFRIELITETLNIQSFHYIQTLLQNYYENMTTDKKKISVWSRRMHKGIRAYQELLMTLMFMDKSDKREIRESSRILKNKVFYVVEYRELVLILLLSYDEQKMSKLYLKDLIETTHIFLKLLEGICGKQRHLLVQKKLKRKKVKSKKGPSKNLDSNPPSEEQLVMQWEEKSETLLALIKGEVGELVPTFPYDPVSDVSEEVQKENAMRKINLLLRKGEVNESLSLLRSSRDIWPEGDIFGASNIDPFEELQCMRMIFMADINDNIQKPDENPVDEKDEMDSDEEEEEKENYISEQEFDFEGFVRRFANIKVMQAYSLLFKNFLKNTEEVNHYILKMFHRLVWDCKLVAIFFQASIFKTFQIIMEQPRASSKSNEDALKFIKFIFRKFLEVVDQNKKVFVELLFWKTPKEALEIELGYATDHSSKAQSKGAWAEEEDDELQRLFEEFRNSSVEGKDTVDLITENLINQNRSRRMVIKRLKALGLIMDVKEFRRKTVKTKKILQWSEEEIMELKTLVEEYKDAVYPISLIMENLSTKRSRYKVVAKILELGLVQSKKELNKKPSKRRKNNLEENFINENNFENLSDSSDSGSEEDVPISRASSSKQRRNNIKRFRAREPTPAAIKAQLTKVLNDEWQDAVEWIAELLQETADEREEDGDFEPVPVIAITDICREAMENTDFQQLLQITGVRPPQDHQEMFWRIPSDISVGGLRKRASYLFKGIRGEISEGEESDNMSQNLQNTNIKNNYTKGGRCSLDSDDSDYETLQNLRKYEKENKDANNTLWSKSPELSSKYKKLPMQDITPEKLSNVNKIPESQKNNSSTKENAREVTFLNDSDSDDSSLPKNKRRMVVMSDDDSDSENVPAIARSSKKLKIIENSEEE